MLATTRDRIGAALGAAFVVLIFIGNSLNTAGTDQSAHPSGEHVLRDTIHIHNSAGASVGFVLEVLGFVAFFGFLGYLGDLLRRRSQVGEPRIAAMTTLVAGIVMLAIKLGSAAPSATLDLDRHTLSPQLAQVLNDLNGAAFVVSWLPFAVVVGAAAVALKGIAAIGKPTAYIGVLLGVAGIVLTLVGLRDVTNASPVAFLLGMLWVLVVSVRLAVKPPTAATSSYDATAGERVAVSA
jgi:hypothetical protein